MHTRTLASASPFQSALFLVLMMTIVVLLAAFAAVVAQQPSARVSAHSGVHCTDYVGSPDKYEESKCLSLSRGAVATSNPNLELKFGDLATYNDEAHTCQLQGRSTLAQEVAVYSQGSIHCVNWPTNNHVYWEPEGWKAFRASDQVFLSVSNQSDPSQADFHQHPVLTNIGVRDDTKLNCLGFGRAPDYVGNTGKAQSTGCFFVSQEPGNYTYQWNWYRDGDKAHPNGYKTCWDAVVVPRNASSPANATVPMQGYGAVVDKFPGAGDTCRKDWASQDELFYASIALNFTNVWDPIATEDAQHLPL